MGGLEGAPTKGEAGVARGILGRSRKVGRSGWGISGHGLLISLSALGESCERVLGINPPRGPQ